jgi:hypothetical protein
MWHAMTSLMIFSMLTGMLLGLFFRVLVLVPATIATLMVLCSFIPYFSPGTWLIVSVSVITALQVGYLGGSALVPWLNAPARHTSPSRQLLISGAAVPLALLLRKTKLGR